MIQNSSNLPTQLGLEPLVIVTPNSESIGHALFKANWRGLEPPGHLNIMSANAIQNAIKGVGFKIELIRTNVCSGYMLQTSYALSKKRALKNGTGIGKGMEYHLANFAALLQYAVSYIRPNSGEVIHLVATK